MTKDLYSITKNEGLVRIAFYGQGDSLQMTEPAAQLLWEKLGHVLDSKDHKGNWEWKIESA